MLKPTMGAAAVACLFVCVSAGRAAADWNGTIWGMSPTQADSAFRIPHRAATPEELMNWSLSGMEAKIAFDNYAVGALDFKVGVLLFEQKKLEAIEMALADPEHCDDLIKIMEKLYGKPDKDKKSGSVKEDQSFDHLLTWYNEDNHNKIQIHYRNYNDSMIENDCRLQYQPYIVPPKGTL